MNYEKIYNQLIEKRRNEPLIKGEVYCETHHIVPRCCNGSDEVSNLVNLTSKEHIVAHQLLARIYKDKRNLWFAAWAMLPKGKCLRKFAEKRMQTYNSGENNPMYGHSCTEYMSDEKIKLWKANISKATKGENNPMFGKSSWEKCTAEERQIRIEKFKKSIKGKNKGKKYGHFWTKDNVTIMAKECPGEGWIKGMGRVIKYGKWWNNGVKAMRSEECPGEGWVKGRLRGNK